MDKKAAYKNFLTLVDSLQVLAARYHIQKKTFPSFVCIADELALNFDDHFHFLDKYISFQIINSKQVDLLREMNFELTEMSKNKILWTDDALRDSEEWDRIRELAKRILQVLEFEQQPPDSSSATYIHSNDKK